MVYSRFFRMLPRSLSDASLWHGLSLVGVLSMAAMGVAQLHAAQMLGLSAVTLAILLGILAGNTILRGQLARAARGVQFSRNTLLRTGIILYGFRITFQQIAGVGAAAIAIDVAIASLTFWLALQAGVRVFKLDRQTAMLIGAGSAFCGAAAVLAAEPIVQGRAHKVSVAVATVVVFGTVSMLLYPLLYPYMGLSERAYGVFVGSTIHEVAQVVVAGRSVGEVAAGNAVIVKMLRVMLLAPFLMWLSSRSSSCEASGAGDHRIVIPWFALLFIGTSALHSLQWLPHWLVNGFVLIDTVLLTMAMAALGLVTQVGAIRQAGLKPLMLAFTLFVFLSIGGYGINRFVMWI